MTGSTESLDFGSEAWEPLRGLFRFAAILGVSVIVGMVIPGWFAFQSQVFFKQPMEQLVFAKYPDVKTKLEAYNKRNQDLKNDLDALDRNAAGSTTGISASTSEVLRNLQKEIATPAPASIQPYYLHIIMYFWPTMFCALGATIVMLRPTLHDRVAMKERSVVIAVLAGAIFIFQFLPIGFRTLLLRQAGQGRVVYAYSNPDLSTPCFFMQVIHFVLFSVLLAIIWERWSRYAVDQKARLEETVSAQSPLRRYSESVQLLAESLLQWQKVFATISVGFIVYTAIFWNQIIRIGDKRFWIEAIVAHVLWVTTLIVTAVPLFMTWRASQAAKMAALGELTPLPDDSTTEATISVLHELDPVGNWNVAATVATVLSTLLGPLIQAFIK